jgi:hypothetical protein
LLLNVGLKGIKTLDFFFKVKTDGPWDIKKYPEWQTASLYIFNGEIVDKDAPGNILYGYMGTEYNFLPITLETGGNVAQWMAGTVNRAWIPQTLGDDPKDRDNIYRGIALWHEINRIR